MVLENSTLGTMGMGQVMEDVDFLLESLLVETKKLVLHNDDVNTFDWVIKCLMDICSHDFLQAEQCSLIVHFKGKCQVKEGMLEQLHPLKQALIERGLNVTIE